MKIKVYIIILFWSIILFSNCNNDPRPCCGDENDTVKISDFFSKDCDISIENIDSSIKFISQKNQFIKILGDSLGIKFTELPIPNKDNILSIEKSKILVSLYKSYLTNDSYFDDFRNYNEKFSYYSFVGAKYLLDNIEKNDLTYFGEIVYIQPDVVQLFVDLDAFISLNNIETLSDNSARILGTHKNNSLYMYDLKYISLLQASLLFKHNDFIKIHKVEHIDSLIAENIANNVTPRIDIGPEFDENEKLIWIHACYRNNWKNALGNKPTLKKDEAVNNCITILTPRLVEYQNKISMLNNLSEKDLIREKDILLHNIFEGIIDGNSSHRIEKELIHFEKNLNAKKICNDCIWNSEENEK